MQDKPLDDLGRVYRRVGAEQGLGVADQHPADGDGRFAQAVPDGDLGRDLHDAGGAVVTSDGGHGALARGHRRDLGVLPGWIGEQRCEGSEYRSNDIRQGEHGRAFREKLGQHRLPCLYTFFSNNAQSPD